MKTFEAAQSFQTARAYILDHFEPEDRLATVMVNRQTRSATQRLATAEAIASPDFQSWLRHKNAQRCEIYISMNTLHPNARGREKADVKQIRHVYLDLDHNASATLQVLLRRADVPKPHSVIHSSADKRQVIWRVDGFEKEAAENLQRGLVRELGADPAAVDCARVLRLPGFYNHKYQPPQYVTVDSVSNHVCRPQDFGKFMTNERQTHAASDYHPDRLCSRRENGGALSQSERDWSFAKRALARGDSEQLVIAAIASYRRYDKHNPEYYARHTVQKAAEMLQQERAANDTAPER